MKRTLTVTAAALTLVAGAAFAQSRTAPADWMTLAELAAQVEAQGYTLIEAERDDGVYEVEMTDSQGFRVEAHLDPVTGDRLRGPRWDD